MLLGIVQELSAQPWAEIVATARNGLEAVEMVETHTPDVLVLDLSMPEIDGDEVTRRLTAKGLVGEGRTLIIAHSAWTDPQRAREMHELGASGYICKDDDPHVLHDAIRAVMKGKTWWTIDINASTPSTLTPREMEVGALIASGLGSDQVAADLSISPDTVKSHIKKAKKKLGISTITQFVATFWKNNWVQR